MPFYTSNTLGGNNSSQSADGEGELITGDVDVTEYNADPDGPPENVDQKPVLIHVVNGQQDASESIKAVPAGPSSTVSFHFL